MIDEKVQQDFWLSEFVRSNTAVRRGIDNMPHATQMANIRNVLAPGMQRIRNLLGATVQITSGYRSPALNAAIGGSKTSQHMDGLAADFISPRFGPPRAIVRYLMERSGEIRFDQLIYEGQWVHVSFAPSDWRSEVLTAHFPMGGGPVTYTKGLA